MDAIAEIGEPLPSAQTLLAEATAALTATGVSTARLDAEVLLAAACDLDRTSLYVRVNQPVTPAARRTFEVCLERRLQREPSQYIVGRQEFWSLDFAVTPEVLIPRPETELLVEVALAIGSPLHTICDLGTGSGCLAVALARELPSAEIWAIDQSTAALAVARQNALRNGVESIRFVGGDLFAPIADVCLDLIVCNPPYIASSVLQQLEPELAWEPRAALDGGVDGLDVVRRVVAGAPTYLADGGWLLMEIGADQGAAALELAHAARLNDVAVRDDYAGRPRVLLARR